MKNRNGITLIALVITIVILIILAGVAINLTLGENGILNKAQQAKQKQSEAEAREKLELVLVNARIEKETNVSYDDDYLNDMLEGKGITVDGSSVIVDNYNFLIDREELIIVNSLGETQIKVTAEVQEYLGKNVNEKYEASLLLIVESNAGLQSVVIANPDGTTFEVETEKIKLGKDMTVELDAEYIVTVTTKDGKETTRKIVEKSEETIGSVAELVAFRDAVNSGLTFEGKTISLTQDIDLSSVCGENVNGEEVSWEPIGTETTPFKGIFEGNGKTINYIYINNNEDYQGLFGYILNANINNIKIGENSCIIGKYKVASIAGYSKESNIIGCSNYSYKIEGYTASGIAETIEKSQIINCTNYTSINSNFESGGIVGNATVQCIISNCVNYANLQAGVGDRYERWADVGGILGNGIETTIQNCYNIGSVTSSQYVAGGIIGAGYSNVIKNNYNIGHISGWSNRAGGIIGAWDDSGEDSYFENNYWLSGIGVSYGRGSNSSNIGAQPVDSLTLKGYASTLGNAYVTDGKIKNSNGEWVDNVDDKGNIIYINKGYPILKWQVEE